MKTLIIAISIFVTAHGKTVKLTATDTAYLQAHGTNLVKRTLNQAKPGTAIRNNEAADQILKLLNK